MAQEGFDTLMTRTDSRYRLSMVAVRRAGQLKQGVPSTLTGKPLARADNAVTVALKELEVGSGGRWGDLLPSAKDIRAQVQRDGRERADVAEASTSRATRRKTTVTGSAAARAVAQEALGGGKRVRA